MNFFKYIFVAVDIVIRGKVTKMKRKDCYQQKHPFERFFKWLNGALWYYSTN